MMTVSKPFLTLASIAVALMLGGGVYIYTNLNSLAEHIAEKVASDALGVEVSIGSMKIDMESKIVKVHGLTVANPAGYTKPYALKIEKIDIGLESFSKDLINFKNFNIDQAQIFLEVKENGTNLKSLTNGMKTKPPSADAPKPVKVIVQNFTLTQSQLTPSVVLMRDKTLSSILIPDIALSGIGQKENGVFAREAIAQVMNHIVTVANRSAAQAGFFEGLSGDQLKEIGLSRFQVETDKLKGKLQEGINSVFGQ